MKRLTLAGIVLAMCAACTLPARAQVSGQLTYTYNSVAHITTNTTTTIAPAPHILVAICINTKGATANTATIYDGTSSDTALAVIDTTVTYGCLTYNVALVKGLSVVTASGTAADLTLVYR